MASIQERIDKLKNGNATTATATSGSIQERIDKLKGTPASALSTTTQKEDSEKESSKKVNALGYVADRVGADIAEGTEGFINTMSFLGQLLGKQQQQQAAESQAAFSALIGKKEQAKASLEQSVELGKELYGHNKNTTLPATFGDKKAAEVSEKYADADIGKGLQFVGDVAGGIGSFIPAAVSNFFVPGSGLAVSAMSAAGNAMQEAKNEGKDDAQAMLYGSTVGMLEAAVEKLTGGMAGVFGKGIADESIENIVKSYLKNESAQKAVSGLMSAIGEGGEEFVTELGNRLANELIIDTDNRSLGETLGDAGRSFLIGSVVGGIVDTAGSIGGKAISAKDAAAQASQNIKNRVANKPQNSPSGGVFAEATNNAAESGNADVGKTGEAVKASTSAFDASILADLNQARTKFIEYAKAHFPASVVNKETGKQIGISRKGLDKFLSGRIAAEKYASGFHIPALIENATLVSEANNYHSDQAESIPTYEYYDSPVDIDGKQYTAHIRVRNTLMGDKYYGHTISEVEDIEIEPSARTSAPVKPAVQPVNAIDDSGNNIPQDGGNSNSQSVGAAAAGFTETGEQGFAPTQSRGVTDSNWMDEQTREAAAPGEHQVITNAQSMTAARQPLDFDEQGNITNYTDAVDFLIGLDKWGSTDGDTAMLLMQEASRRQDWDTVRSLAKRYNELGTEAGQTLQARQKWIAQSSANIVSEAATTLEGTDEQTANDTLEVVSELAQDFDAAANTQNVDGLIEIIRRTAAIRGTAGMFSTELSRTAEWALGHVVEQGDIDFLRTMAANGIANIAADQVRPSAADGVRTYRRLSMLSKVSTTMRNLVSNGVFDITDTFSRNISVPLDMLLSNFTGTRSVAGDAGIFSAAKRQGNIDGLARSILEVGLDVDAQGNEGRYETTANRTFHMSGGIMSRLLSTWEKYSGYALATTDAAAQAGTAAEVQRGIDRLYERGRISDDSLRDAGHQEARYRTFQDDTTLSRVTLGARNALNNVQIGGVGLGDIALPFARTPANLASRALEYSPLGLARGAYDLAQVLRHAHNGALTAAEQARAVQEIGRGLNGSALIAISTAAAASGIIKTLGSGKDDEDKDKTAFAKMSGQNGTQINLDALMRWVHGEGAEWQDGDTLMSIGFLEPLNAQLTTGALIADDIKNGEFEWSDAFKRSAEGAIKAVLEMPVMSTIAEAMEAYEYAEGDNAGAKAIEAGIQYGASQVSSLVPNVVKGIAQGADPVQRNAYTADTLGGQIVDNIKSGIPGLRETLPAKTDSYGKEMRYTDGVMGWLNTNILPGAFNKYTPATGTELLDSVYELTGVAGIYPDRAAPGSVDQGGKSYELSADEKRRYLETSGSKYESMVKAVESSSAFASLDAGQQAEILTKLRTAAEDAAKAELLESRGVDAGLSDKDAAIQALSSGDVVKYYSLITGFKALEDGATASEAATMEKLMEQPVSSSIGEIIMEGDYKKMYDATQAGVSVRDFCAVRGSIKSAQPAKGYADIPQWQKFNTIGSSNLSDVDKLTMIGLYGSESAAGKVQQAYDSGIALSDILAYYEAVSARNSDGTDKSADEKRAAANALGLDAAVLKTLNDIF